MFESAELGQKVARDDFEQQLTEIRPRLLDAQRRLRETGRSVIIVVSGVEGAGKSEVVNRLHEWLDARGIQTTAFWQDSEEERERPRYWRFWRRLPPRGSIGIMFGSWYTAPIIDRVMGDMPQDTFDEEMYRIAFFEHELSEDGTLILKFWFHITKKEQKKRLEAREKKDGKKWGLNPEVKKFSRSYEKFLEVSERAIRMTDTADAPWHVIEASNARYRDLTVAQTVLQKLEELCAPRAVAPPAAPAEPAVAYAAPLSTILDSVDMTASISPEEYDGTIEEQQAKLSRHAWKAWNGKRSTVLLFEGWDAGGKGGAIRRAIAAIDARLYQVISVAAPTDEERARHYLWRFWRHLPRAGHVTIYDRSWYGRVLVERVEGFAKPEEWSRAYREINDFEQQLVESGIILAKFWMNITKEEQLRRFQEREVVPWKQHKITEEDWRNREKWDAYEVAVNEMIERTSTAAAPWTIVPANDKHYARVKVLETVNKAMKRGLKG
ncbi:MAG: polyphosphate:AMP phosphotransferase [Thermoanaerobaculia bacterium]